MTICIAAICNDYSGLVLASDSMLTNPYLSLEFEQPTKKMTQLSDLCFALTAGNAVAHTELFNAVQGEIKKLKTPSISEIVGEIKKCYQSIRKREICERILIPRGFDSFDEYYQAQRLIHADITMKIQYEIDNYDYGLSIIASGISEEKAQIFYISDPGTSQCYDSIGFHTIGSGSPHAINTLTARGCHQALSLEDVLVIVYEAKKMAERAPGVGRITNLTVIKDNKAEYLSNDKIDKLSEIYEKWLRKENNWKNEIKRTIL